MDGTDTPLPDPLHDVVPGDVVPGDVLPGDGLPEDWIEIGSLLKVRGRIGELTALFDSSKPDRADSLTRVALRNAMGTRLFEIENVRYHDGRPVLKFAGIDSISEAEPWAGAAILVPAAERVELDEGEYFHEDLIGCAVELCSPGESFGMRIGQVDGVEDLGGPTLLRLKLERNVGGAKAGKLALIPFKRELCHHIDIAAKRILADIPDGLLEL